jgi:hypothetical protein
VTTPDGKPYGRSLALWSLPFWLLSIFCLVYGIANGLLFTTVCAVAATVWFPIMVARRWRPPESGPG